MQLAAAAEAAERIAQLEEEAAARDAQIDELRAALIAKGSGGVPPSPAKKPPWKETRDDRGRTYFYNSTTREVSWTRPAEMGSPAVDGGGATPAEHASETGELRAANAQLTSQLRVATARLERMSRATKATLQEQQQQVVDAISIGSSNFLRASLGSWAHHLLSGAFRSWVIAAAYIAPSKVANRTGALHSVLRAMNGAAAARAIGTWRAAAALTTGRRLMLTQQLLNAQGQEQSDIALAAAAMRVQSAVHALLLAPLPSAFARWAALATTPAVLAAPPRAQPSPRRDRTAERAGDGDDVTEGARRDLSAQRRLELSLADERAAARAAVRRERVTRATLCRELLALEAVEVIALRGSASARRSTLPPPPRAAPAPPPPRSRRVGGWRAQAAARRRRCRRSRQRLACLARRRPPG